MVVVRAASARTASARAATSRAAALRTAARLAGTAHHSHRVPRRNRPTASHRVPGTASIPQHGHPTGRSNPTIAPSGRPVCARPQQVVVGTARHSRHMPKCPPAQSRACARVAAGTCGQAAARLHRGLCLRAASDRIGPPGDNAAHRSRRTSDLPARRAELRVDEGGPTDPFEGPDNQGPLLSAVSGHQRRGGGGHDQCPQGTGRPNASLLEGGETCTSKYIPACAIVPSGRFFHLLLTLLRVTQG